MNSLPSPTKGGIAAETADTVHLTERVGEASISALPLTFELINPSDSYTFRAASLEIAAMVTILLGRGQYSAKSLDTPPNDGVPFFMFGGHDAWFQERCGCDLDAYAEQMDDAALADSLESVELTSGNRSSLNNIGQRAKQYAERFRATKATP